MLILKMNNLLFSLSYFELDYLNDLKKVRPTIYFSYYIILNVVYTHFKNEYIKMYIIFIIIEIRWIILTNYLLK